MARISPGVGECGESWPGTLPQEAICVLWRRCWGFLRGMGVGDFRGSWAKWNLER